MVSLLICFIIGYIITFDWQRILDDFSNSPNGKRVKIEISLNSKIPLSKNFILQGKEAFWLALSLVIYPERFSKDLSFIIREKEGRNFFRFSIVNLIVNSSPACPLEEWKRLTKIFLREISDKIPEIIIELNIIARIRKRRLSPVFIAAIPIAIHRITNLVPSLVNFNFLGKCNVLMN